MAAVPVPAFEGGAHIGGAQWEQPRRRRPGKAALLAIGCVVAAAPQGPANEVNAPEAADAGGAG